MKQYNIKAVDAAVMDADQSTRTVKVAFSQMGSVDRDNDIINSGAFTKTIKERGPKGSNQVWHLVDHNASLKSVLGKPHELYEESSYLIGITKMIDTPLGNDMLKMYADGLINQHSIGFSIIKDEMSKKDNVRIIKEVALWEGSAVLWGANPNTPTFEVMKGMNEEEKKVTLNQRLERLFKALKHGSYTDESFSLLEIEIKQIQQQILEMTTTPAEAVKSDEEKVIEQLLLITKI
jgi:HK97 family phage prohead protease